MTPARELLIQIEPPDAAFENHPIAAGLAAPADSAADRMACEGAAAALFKKVNGARRIAVRLLDEGLKLIFGRGNPRRAIAYRTVRHVLVFEPGSLGDITMLLPFLQSLRKGLPRARISLVCRSATGRQRKSYASISRSSIETLVLRQGLADELIPVPIPWLRADPNGRRPRYNLFSRDWLAFVTSLYRLRRRRFDLAFAGGRTDIRYNFALWLTGAARRVGYGYAGGARLLTEVVTPDMSRPHQSELALHLLEHLSIPSVRNEKVLTVSPADRKKALHFLWDHGIKPGDFAVGIHPGSRVPARTWGEHGFREVARQLIQNFGVKVIWFVEPVDQTSPPSDPNVVPAALPLPEFLAVLSACNFLVCNDSGPMHMSGALGVPVVAIFGSTFPEWFRPPGPLHRVVTRRDVPCRPCGDRCLYDEPYCLRLIPVEQVMTEVRAMMDSLQFQRRAQGS